MPFFEQEELTIFDDVAKMRKGFILTKGGRTHE